MNIGISKQTFRSLIGSPSLPSDRDSAEIGGENASDYDFTALDQVMPHPVSTGSKGANLEAVSYWIAVLTGLAGMIGTYFWWKFADQRYVEPETPIPTPGRP